MRRPTRRHAREFGLLSGAYGLLAAIAGPMGGLRRLDGARQHNQRVARQAGLL